MKPPFIIARVVPLLLLIVSGTAFGQTATMTTGGNWSTAASWTSSDIGDAITETVVLNTGVGAAIQNGENYTVGNTTFTQDNTVTLETTSSLTIGASGNAKNLVVGNNGNITVDAGSTLEIWGTFNATANFSFNISGTVHIHGSAQFSNVNTSVQVSAGGHLYIDGAMAGGQNVNFNVNGYVEVGGALAVSSGSNLTGSGTFVLHGGCAGPSSFCASSVLPVDLLYFRSRNAPANVELVWATGSEMNLDYFLLERSLDGKSFNEVTKVIGTGDTNEERIYTYVDEKPSAGTSFYRLSEVSRDGEKKALNTIRNVYDASKGVYISPNPVVKDQPLSFTLNFRSSEPHEISVFDVRGVLMHKATMNGSEGIMPLNLGTGVYIVRVASSEFSSVQRIVVQ